MSPGHHSGRSSSVTGAAPVRGIGHQRLGQRDGPGQHHKVRDHLADRARRDERRPTNFSSLDIPAVDLAEDVARHQEDDRAPDSTQEGEQGLDDRAARHDQPLRSTGRG